tara:strand:- start:25763 stop:26239 length:477 start_codon:yes stop_codon:yes gene_type:complete
VTAFSLAEFKTLLKSVTDAIAECPLDKDLEDALNEQFPPSAPVFEDIKAACLAGISSGDLCAREAGGIAFGRPLDPGPDLAGYSVDVVRMKDVVGPHHRHPRGEIDLIMPLDDTAKFDGKGAGWMVYGPGSAHKPTVTDGDAIVLYLLPQGEIEFTRH